MRGMTKVEVIVVIALAVVVIAADVATILYLRNRTRDVQVLSEISQIRSALESYRVIANSYPIAPEAVQLADAYQGTQKLCAQGFMRFTQKCDRTVMARIPSTGYYQYRSLQDGGDYQLQFTLVTAFQKLGFAKGTACATSAGIANQTCF